MTQAAKTTKTMLLPLLVSLAPWKERGRTGRRRRAGQGHRMLKGS